MEERAPCLGVPFFHIRPEEGRVEPCKRVSHSLVVRRHTANEVPVEGTQEGEQEGADLRIGALPIAASVCIKGLSAMVRGLAEAEPV